MAPHRRRHQRPARAADQRQVQRPIRVSSWVRLQHASTTPHKDHQQFVATNQGDGWPGCDHRVSTRVYACHRVHGSPRQRIFYELYRDRAAFEEPERQEHVRHFMTARTALLESTEVDRMTLADDKTPVADQAAHGLG